jgi:hypothetical protein
MFIWTIGDAISLFVFLAIAVLLLLAISIDKIKQWRCKHFGFVRENHSCDAICCKCNKNLGFIGTWREMEKQRGVL